MFRVLAAMVLAVITAVSGGLLMKAVGGQREVTFGVQLISVVSYWAWLGILKTRSSK